MNKLRIKTEQLENLPINKNRFDCTFEIYDSIFECEEVEEKKPTAHDEKVAHYESMGYKMIEDWCAAKKTLMVTEVPGVGPYYVTITNGVPELGDHMK